jgi:hypothetical protein
MKALIDFMNWLTDMDWGWWPLLSARPSKEKPIDSIVLAKITPFFGTLTGLLIAVIANHFTSLRRVLVDVGLAWVLFFIGYRLTFAIAWNSRARLLRRVFEPVASPNGSLTERSGNSEAGGEPPSVR